MQVLCECSQRDKSEIQPRLFMAQIISGEMLGRFRICGDDTHAARHVVPASAVEGSRQRRNLARIARQTRTLTVSIYINRVFMHHHPYPCATGVCVWGCQSEVLSHAGVIKWKKQRIFVSVGENHYISLDSLLRAAGVMLQC